MAENAMDVGLSRPHPLIPAEAGTQCFGRKRLDQDKRHADDGA